jgi:hypothetical protein
MSRDTTASTVMAKGITAESMVMAEEDIVMKVDITAGMVMVMVMVIMEKGIMEGLATVEDITVADMVMVGDIIHMVMAEDIIHISPSGALLVVSVKNKSHIYICMEYVRGYD